jgi:hypothetical protein
MPYSVRKQDNKYCVYKKDSGEKVGCTAGNKEALRKYMAALHMNENNTTMKLADLVKENAQGIEAMSTEQKKAFLEAVYKFADHANNIYRSHSIQETAKALNHMIEAANHLTLSETEDWFDKVTVSRHMKQLGEAQKIFEKTATEMSTLQQRLESAYEDIGGVLGKYYDIGSMVNEAAESGPDYQTFFKKALKKFKVSGPQDLESDKSKKKFFNYVDANYTSEKEKVASAEPKPKEKEEPKKEVDEAVIFPTAIGAATPFGGPVSLLAAIMYGIIVGVPFISTFLPEWFRDKVERYRLNKNSTKEELKSAAKDLYSKITPKEKSVLDKYLVGFTSGKDKNQRIMAVKKAQKYMDKLSARYPKEETNESTYAFGSPVLESNARKKVWNMIIRNSSDMSKLKKIGSLAESITGTKTPIVDMGDAHELVDNLSSKQFERFYNSLKKI